MPRYPVTNVDDAYEACHPEIPLTLGDPRYVDLTPVRGGSSLVTKMIRRISRTRDPLYHKQLITGHRGCGKSTELKHLQARLLDDGFFTVYLDVEDVLDPNDIEYLDILLAVARAVAEAVDDEGLHLPDDPLQPLYEWFAEIVLTEEQFRRKEKTRTAEAGLSSPIPILRLLIAATGVLQSGGEQRVQVRRQLEQELRVFLQRLNDFLSAAQVRLRHNDWKGLVVIVDGLEKMPYRTLSEGQTNHSVFFVQHAEQLKTPRCHVIYTVPISLVFNVNLGDAFPVTDIIPMVSPDEPGRAALMEVVAKRMDLASVFDSPDSVERLVEISGGSMRDLLRVVRFACDEADERIIEAHVTQAMQNLVREYDYLVKDDDLDHLAQVVEDQHLTGDDTSARLLHQRLVLEYFDATGERWAKLHPAVAQVPRVQRRLKPRS